MEVMLFSAGGLRTSTLDDIKPLLAENKPDVIWIDINHPRLEDMLAVRDLFNFHPLAIEDARNQFQRPKVEEYADHLFIIMNSMLIVRNYLEFQELDIFVGSRYIVTVHRHCQPVIKEVKQRIERAGFFKHISSEYLLYMISDTVVDAYFPVLDQIDSEIDELGERVFANPSERILSRLFTLKRMLNESRQVAVQQSDMFSVLTRHEEDLLMNHEVLHYYLRDVHDHLQRIADITNAHRDNVNNIFDLYMSSTSNRLNKVVNRLSVITIVIGILTVVSGFYGMNFQRTWPPSSADWGVLFVVALMAGLVGAVLIAFKRLDLF
jgi:magnesium transporter